MGQDKPTPMAETTTWEIGLYEARRGLPILEVGPDGVHTIVAYVLAAPESNGPLIASARSLKSALEDLMDFVPYGGGPPAMRKAALKARTAIAKATQEPSGG